MSLLMLYVPLTKKSGIYSGFKLAIYSLNEEPILELSIIPPTPTANDDFIFTVHAPNKRMKTTCVQSINTSMERRTNRANYIIWSNCYVQHFEPGKLI